MTGVYPIVDAVRLGHPAEKQTEPTCVTGCWLSYFAD